MTAIGGGNFSWTKMKTIWQLWLKLGETLAKINTKIILILIFFTVITPMGWLLKITGKKLLGDGAWIDRRRIDKKQLLKQY